MLNKKIRKIERMVDFHLNNKGLKPTEHERNMIVVVSSMLMVWSRIIRRPMRWVDLDILLETWFK